MSPALAWWEGIAGVFVRDVLVFVSYRARFIGQLLTAFFSLTLFYYISRLVQFRGFTPDEYYAFAVVGLVILQVLNSTLGTPPMALRQELVAGTFERVALSPLGPTGLVVGMLMFPFLYALATAVVMLGFASVVFGLDVEWATAPLALPLSLLGAIAFAPFGVLVLSVVLVFKQALAGATWIVALISLLAGLYFPVALLPEWSQWATEVQPFTPAVDLLRNVLVGTPMTNSVGVALAKLVGFSAVMWPLAMLVLHLSVRWAQRRGTIIEY